MEGVANRLTTSSSTSVTRSPIQSDWKAGCRVDGSMSRKRGRETRREEAARWRTSFRESHKNRGKKKRGRRAEERKRRRRERGWIGRVSVRD